jgi:hypothetical protein
MTVRTTLQADYLCTLVWCCATQARADLQAIVAGGLGPRTVHLCIDMQTLFAERRTGTSPGGRDATGGGAARTSWNGRRTLSARGGAIMSTARRMRSAESFRFILDGVPNVAAHDPRKFLQVK